MKQTYGMSKNGNLAEAVRGITHPKLLFLLSNTEQFEQHVKELAELFPDTPSIGCIGGSYSTQAIQEGVAVLAYEGNLTVATNVLEQASSMPVKYIRRLEDDVRKVGADERNTVCIDFCSGNDASVLTTIYSVLGKKRIPLVGGTGDAGKVCCNGVVYEDADAYALIRNNDGKVKVYKENMYTPMEGYRFIASRTDRSSYYLGELNGKPAKKLYQDILQIRESDIGQQTFRNPFGKMNGQDICIISIKDVVGDGLSCYRQVNDSDVLTLLQVQDYAQIVSDTIRQIKSDFTHVSAVFSINCMFRYLFFSQENYFGTYLNAMSSLGDHAGLIGYGEHFNQQFVNQTMTCVVFE